MSRPFGHIEHDKQEGDYRSGDENDPLDGIRPYHGLDSPEHGIECYHNTSEDYHHCDVPAKYGIDCKGQQV